MLVDFDLQIGLSSHRVSEKVLDEGVGAAAEIGDEDAVEARVLADVLRRAQDLLAETPVHGLDFVQVLHFVHRQEVHGHGQDPQVPELPVQIEVHARVKGVVGPADEDHGAVVRAAGCPGFPGPWPEGSHNKSAGRPGPFHGPVDRKGGDAQLFTQSPACPGAGLFPPAEIEHRREELGAVGGKIDG